MVTTKCANTNMKVIPMNFLVVTLILSALQILLVLYDFQEIFGSKTSGRNLSLEETP